MKIQLSFEGYLPKRWPWWSIPKKTFISQKSRERVVGDGATGIFQLWWLGTKYQFEWYFKWPKKKKSNIILETRRTHDEWS